MGEPVRGRIESSQRIEPGSFNLTAVKWPPTAHDAAASPESIAASIIEPANRALANHDYRAFSDLFLEDGFLRDHLAISWELRTLKGRDIIQTFLERECNLVKISLDQSSAWRSPQVASFAPAGDVKGIAFYITAETRVGSGRGVVRLVENNGAWKIWSFYTVLEELRGFEEPSGRNRPKGAEHGSNADRKSWLERRIETADFAKGEPDVLIIGAGQAGLTAHARLKMLNVPTLIIDANAAVGDSWRKRYRQLVLHDPVWYDHMPYMPFPESWPVFTPKDKVAEWFDIYAKVLELNIWTRSTLQSATWDQGQRRWTVVINSAAPDGSPMKRTVHPKHIIQATGHSGKRNMPDIPGQESFNGDLLCHSANFPGAKESGKGKKAVVVGACNSSHDICQDYYEKGYEVTMVQRSSTCVVSSEAVLTYLLGGVYEEGGPPVEDGDIFVWGWPSEIFKAIQSDLTKIQVGTDAKMLEGLRNAGFMVDNGVNDSGLFIKYLQRGGGYYIDVGSAALITEGKVKVKHGQEITQILPHGLKFADGSELEADEIVFATGYANMRSEARSIFGDAVADQISDVWGWDEEGEIRGLWKASGHPGFWLHAGNMAICRYFSRILALQIKARLEGLVE
ncbi:FAD/NAD(P)-binding domain-containing protein [Thozetella sp. PMI_491]|nr:FAD/NAD(P)-binding domain-containing protein [Thozetella sp. PMI_491]